MFEEAPTVPAVRLPLDVQAQLRQALVQWMQALAKMMHKEGSNEQDNRRSSGPGGPATKLMLSFWSGGKSSDRRAHGHPDSHRPIGEVLTYEISVLWL
jgi:hypothetical protein